MQQANARCCRTSGTSGRKPDSLRKKVGIAARAELDNNSSSSDETGEKKLILQLRVKLFVLKTRDTQRKLFTKQYWRQLLGDHSTVLKPVDAEIKADVHKRRIRLPGFARNAKLQNTKKKRDADIVPNSKRMSNRHWAIFNENLL